MFFVLDKNLKKWYSISERNKRKGHGRRYFYFGC